MDSNEVSDQVKLDTFHPMDENYYQTFVPDYNACENFIRAIGYNIAKSSLISHRLLLHRSNIHDQDELWMKQEINCYQCIKEKCLETVEKRTNCYIRQSKKCCKNFKLTGDEHKTKMESVYNTKHKKTAKWQQKGRQNRYCCFVGCENTSNDTFVFKYLPPIPKYILKNEDLLKRHLTFL